MEIKKVVTLWGGSLDGMKVTLPHFATTYEHFIGAPLSWRQIDRSNAHKIETYVERKPCFFAHVQTEKRI